MNPRAIILEQYKTVFELKHFTLPKRRFLAIRPELHFIKDISLPEVSSFDLKTL